MVPPNQGDDTFAPPAGFVTMEVRKRDTPSSPAASSSSSSPPPSSSSSASPSPSPPSSDSSAPSLHPSPLLSPPSSSSSPSPSPSPTPSRSSTPSPPSHKTVVRRKVPYFSSQEVSTHSKRKDIWVILNGAIYDITEFLPSHPGGEEVILEYAGRDITEAFLSPDIHSHTDYAWDVLRPHRVGTLDNLEGEDEIFDQNHELAHVIDLEKPIISQMWSKRLPRDVYLKLAHTPHFIKNGGVARLFENEFLEMCSRNSWWVVLAWIPVSFYLLYLTGLAEGWLSACGIFLFGIAFWSFLEYILHRFLFHMDGFLPDHHVAVCAHFFMHGIHHFLPMDPMRLVFPPTLTIIILSGFMALFHSMFSPPIANGIVAGGLFGYIVYDLTHYYLHHASPKFMYMKSLKTYHLNHHYRNYHLGYGVSSKAWDFIFGTVLRD